MTISRAKNIIWGKGECVMIYAMSDIHGQYDLFSKRIEQLRPLLQNNDNKLILLGDYIDRGNQSFECIKLAFDLERELEKKK